MHFVFYTVNLVFYNINLRIYNYTQNIYLCEFIVKPNRIGSLSCIFAVTLMKTIK